MFFRQFNYLFCLCKRICERPVNEIGKSRLDIWLVKDMIPWMVVIAAVNDAVHLAEHIVEIFNRYAAKNFRKILRVFIIYIPAVGDAHVIERCVFFPFTGIDKQPPETLEMRIKI